MRNRPTARLWLPVWAVVAVAWPAGAAAQGLGTLRFEQYLDALRQQAGIPGLSAGIVQEGKLVWGRGFGQADVDRNIGAEADTPYPVAGLTASVSAVQAIQCAERGSLSLDAQGDSGTTLRDALAHVTAGRRFAFDPTHYDAVAGAIKTCAGNTLRATLTAEVLDRLGMADSVPGHDFSTWSGSTLAQYSQTTVDRYSAVMRRLARSYRGNGRGRPTPTTFAPTTGLTGASGIVSTVRDLARFQSSLDEFDLLTPDSMRAALTAPLLADGRPSPHALGWFVQVHEGQLVAWQFGVIEDAYSSLLITLPHRHVTLVLLANSDGLVASLPLQNGDVSVSPFARLFLGLFL